MLHTQSSPLLDSLCGIWGLARWGFGAVGGGGGFSTGVITGPGTEVLSGTIGVCFFGGVGGGILFGNFSFKRVLSETDFVILSVLIEELVSTETTEALTSTGVIWDLTSTGAVEDLISTGAICGLISTGFGIGIGVLFVPFTKSKLLVLICDFSAEAFLSDDAITLFTKEDDVGVELIVLLLDQGLVSITGFLKSVFVFITGGVIGDLSASAVDMPLVRASFLILCWFLASKDPNPKICSISPSSVFSSRPSWDKAVEKNLFSG